MESESEVINEWDIPAMTTPPVLNTSTLRSCSSSGPIFEFSGDIDEREENELRIIIRNYS